jgi:hypothetical protein
MNYDRTHVEAVKRARHAHSFPFLRVFLFFATLVFVLLAVLR